MKKLLLLIVCLICLSNLFGCSEFKSSGKDSSVEKDIKVMTYNIRCLSLDGGNNEEVGGVNYIENRLPRIISNVQEEAPDLIGFQEYTSIHNAEIADALCDEYDYYVVYRDNVTFPYSIFPEATPIFWKKSRFELLDKGAFWFSDTPEEISSFKYVDEESGQTITCSPKRVTTWVKLYDKETAHAFVYFNTHLGLDDKEKAFSVELLRERCLALDCPTIITGDMNIKYDSELSISLVEGLNDASRCENNMRDSCTFQCYGSASQRLDYILSKGLKATTHRVRNNDIMLYDGAYASDHFAVIATLVFE